HFAEVGLHLRKGVIKQFSGRRVDLRNYVEQLTTRISKIIILPFETFLPLLELVVLMNRIQVYRADVIELELEFVDQLFDTWRGELRRAGRCRSSAPRFFASFHLSAQNFFERRLVGRKGAK